MDENIDSIGYEYFLDVLLYSNATKKSICKQGRIYHLYKRQYRSFLKQN